MAGPFFALAERFLFGLCLCCFLCAQGIRGFLGFGGGHLGIGIASLVVFLFGDFAELQYFRLLLPCLKHIGNSLRDNAFILIRTDTKLAIDFRDMWSV